MSQIYCTKCGVRGSSKCPHCRSVFGNSPKAWDQKAAQEYFEMFMNVQIQDSGDRESRIAKGEDARFIVSFWTYDLSNDEAAASVLQTLTEYLPLANMKVAACVHDWQLMPGEKSSIGCGCEGPPVGTPVPDDPFA